MNLVIELSRQLTCILVDPSIQRGVPASNYSCSLATMATTVVIGVSAACLLCNPFTFRGRGAVYNDIGSRSEKIENGFVALILEMTLVLSICPRRLQHCDVVYESCLSKEK